jgi:hypothetical protein
MAETKLLDVAERAVAIFLPVLTAVSGGLWAVWLFTAAQADAERARLIEARKPYLTWQLETIQNVVRRAGKLTIAGQRPEDLQAVRNQLEELLYSELSAVTDRRYKGAIDAYLEALNRYTREPDDLGRTLLRSATRNLSEALQETLKNNWKT